MIIKIIKCRAAHVRKDPRITKQNVVIVKYVNICHASDFKGSLLRGTTIII